LSAARAYEEGRYAEAARLWLEEAPFDQLDADRLYNIGNCWYRLASPGQAALYYRRALLRDPTHSEARQNLRFLERKFGSLAIKLPEYQVLLAKLPISFWRNLVWAGAWMLALGLLVFPATCPGSRIRLTAVVALVLSPVVGGLGGLGWRYYPDDAEFAPPAERAVVVADDAVAHTDAARTSPEVIDAPPGSLCRIIAQRGRWTYVAFATRTCGWLPSEQVEPLIPKSPPKPPNPTRPRATEGST
jgi:tetratricopeptide (TPR) repeat protein